MRVNGHAASQGSDEWLSWRRTKICASDLPIILGDSKWCTPHKLWRRKLGMEPEEQENHHMRRGKELESTVRDMYVIDSGIAFVPAVYANDTDTWAGASLDGINIDEDQILEIKCPAKRTVGLPDQYKAQVFWQMYCSGSKRCHFVSYTDGALDVTIVERDDEYINHIVAAARRFHDMLLNFEEPLMLEDEYVEVSNDVCVKMMTRYKENKDKIKQLEEENNSLKKSLIEHMPASRCYCAGSKMLKVEMKGSVDYSKIPELEGMDLEKYRKKSITVWKIL